MASFQAKTSWESPRRGKNENCRSDLLQKQQKNSKN